MHSGSIPVCELRNLARRSSREAEAAINASEIPEIDVDELECRMQAGAVVFDVRESWEHRQARIPGVVSIPLGVVIDAVDRFRIAAADGPVYVVCAAGGRSAQAVGYLRGCDISAVNVAGGTNAWIEADKPVETGPSTG